MRAHPPDDSEDNLSVDALDEFAVEDSSRTAAANPLSAEAVFCFECEAQPEPTLSVNGRLLNLAPAETPGDAAPQPLSRVDESTARRKGRRRSARRLVIEMQRRSDASDARMRCELAALKHSAQRARRAAAQVWLRSVPLVRQRSASAAATAIAVVRRSGRAAIHLWERSLPLMREGGRAARRRGLYLASHGVAAAESAIASGRRAWADRPRAAARPFAEPSLEYQESNGFVVAVVLAVAVIGYGGFVAASWQTSARAVTSVTAERPGGASATIATVAPVVDTPIVARPAAAPIPPSPAVEESSHTGRPDVASTAAPAVQRPAVFTPSTSTLTSLWRRRDTRSLEQAFSTLRRETLAFHRCGMRMTEVDRAVARCEGAVPVRAADGTQSSRSARWTIDFRRVSGRWTIARVTRS